MTDGELRSDRLQIVRRNRPLSAFLRPLQELAISQLDDQRNRTIEIIFEELLRVDFRVPEGFSQRATISCSGRSAFRLNRTSHTGPFSVMKGGSRMAAAAAVEGSWSTPRPSLTATLR